MKIVVIKSDHSEVPLAEIRTDGQVLDFVVDNTDGQLPQLFQNSYERMTNIVGKSSHLQISEPEKATVNLLRYVMNNGDVVEITSDGHTVILNGSLLSIEEKNALFEAFRRGELRVSSKTDIQQAIPIMPTSPKITAPIEKQMISPAIMQVIRKDQQKKDQDMMLASKDFDQEIEDADLSGAEDAGWVKKLLYHLKYGGSNV
jgi:hypothetical protein